MGKLYRDIHLRISDDDVNKHIDQRKKDPFRFESVNSEFVRILGQTIREQNARAKTVNTGSDDDKCIPRLDKYIEDGIGGTNIGNAYQYDQITWEKAFELYKNARQFIIDFEHNPDLRRRIPWR